LKYLFKAPYAGGSENFLLTPTARTWSHPCKRCRRRNNFFKQRL